MYDVGKTASRDPATVRACIQGFGVSGSQNCNLELSRATSAMKKAATHPAGNSLQDAANSLLGLINSLFGANYPVCENR
jgi:hypothetical protein